MYSERLKDPRWQKKRLEILQRDEWVCHLCFDAESTLVVHHRYYTSGKDPWDYENNALITLCESCHQNEHDHIEAAHTQLRYALAKAGAFSLDVGEIADLFEGCRILNEYEWSVLHQHLKSIIISINENGTLWKEIGDEASLEWSRIGAEKAIP